MSQIRAFASPLGPSLFGAVIAVPAQDPRSDRKELGGTGGPDL
jgi:hypothetical protein